MCIIIRCVSVVCPLCVLCVYAFPLQNEIYKYPDIWVCLYEHYGCDDSTLEEECVRSANATEGGMTTATYQPQGPNEKKITTYSTNTAEVRACSSSMHSEPS